MKPPQHAPSATFRCLTMQQNILDSTWRMMRASRRRAGSRWIVRCCQVGSVARSDSIAVLLQLRLSMAFRLMGICQLGGSVKQTRRKARRSISTRTKPVGKKIREMQQPALFCIHTCRPSTPHGTRSLVFASSIVSICRTHVHICRPPGYFEVAQPTAPVSAKTRRGLRKGRTTGPREIEHAPSQLSARPEQLVVGSQESYGGVSALPRTSTN